MTAIQSGATVNSAYLGLQVHSPGDDINIYRMDVAWTESSTWNSFGGGLAADDFVSGTGRLIGNLDSGSVTDEVTVVQIDVKTDIQSWLDFGANYGWGFTPTGTDGFDFHAANHPFDGHVRPTLQIDFTNARSVPEPATFPLFALGFVAIALSRRARRARKTSSR